MSARAAPANSDVEYANYKTFNAICGRARESLKKAVDADETKVNKTAVVSLYKKAIRDIETALAIPPSSCSANKRQEIREQHEKLNNFLISTQERIITLEDVRLCRNDNSSKAIIANTSQSGTRVHVSSTSCNVKNLNKSKLLRDVNQKYGEEILATIMDNTEVNLNDVEGNGAAKAALEESVVLPSLNPKLFTGLRAPCKGILLFGPPGNGKTMLAKAVANECRCTFFNISAATIMSKWVGDGERLVQALFHVARNAQPAIIFIDEVDSMLCERAENENAAARRVKTEFLIQLDGCSSKSDDRLLVLAATNRPYELDEGILRRFPKRIFIDLPDTNARASMIERTFSRSNTTVSMNRGDFQILAHRTEGYSYSDLDALCRCAALIPLRSVSRSNVHKITASQLRPVKMSDFETALQTIKPSLSIENRQKLFDFARKHAQIYE